MKLLMKKKIPVSGSVKYDPVKFREYMSKRKPLPRDKTKTKRLDIIIDEICNNGYSYIRKSDTDAIRARMRRQGYHWSFRTVKDSNEVKVVPYPD